MSTLSVTVTVTVTVFFFLFTTSSYALHLNGPLDLLEVNVIDAVDHPIHREQAGSGSKSEAEPKILLLTDKPGSDSSTAVDLDVDGSPLPEKPPVKRVQINRHFNTHVPMHVRQPHQENEAWTEIFVRRQQVGPYIYDHVTARGFPAVERERPGLVFDEFKQPQFYFHHHQPRHFNHHDHGEDEEEQKRKKDEGHGKEREVGVMKKIRKFLTHF